MRNIRLYCRTPVNRFEQSLNLVKARLQRLVNSVTANHLPVLMVLVKEISEIHSEHQKHILAKIDDKISYHPWTYM